MTNEDRTREQEELEEGQTDEIGRRMADVIDETEETASEHVDPHWELFYDDHDEAQQIVHLHGDEKVPAKMTARPDGSAIAECTKCDESLDISAATHGRRVGKEASSVN